MVKGEIENLKQYKQGSKGNNKDKNDPALKKLKRDLEDFYALRNDENIEPVSVRVVLDKQIPRANFKLQIESDIDNISEVVKQSAPQIARLGFMSDIQDVKKELRFK